MKVDGSWLSAAGTQRVLGILGDAGHQAYVVGGCVRNGLMGVPVADVDIATDALPERVLALAASQKIKAIPTGADHGTITLIVGGDAFEVTTFRKDIETDGRRAVVAFSANIRDDALRRDFTMNALYAAADGTVVDPLNGLPDLLAHRVRFIEDPARRIQEDYLRILRFFRFIAWFGDPDLGFDPDALGAIADNLEGLNHLSRERIGTEFLRLLSAPDPVLSVSVMAQTGVLQRVLPGSQAQYLGPLVHAQTELDLRPDPLVRLAVLGGSGLMDLRLSKAQLKRIALYQSLIASPMSPNEIAYRHGTDIAQEAAALRSAMFEQPVKTPDRATLLKAAQQRFPVQAKDLMPALEGRALGARLDRLEQIWIASDFAMSQADLLALGDDD